MSLMSEPWRASSQSLALLITWFTQLPTSCTLQQLATMDLKHARTFFGVRYWSALAAVNYGSRSIRKGGSIVLTTGIAGQRPQKGWVVVASMCGTIEALTRALAVELAPIRVNVVSPGVVRTNPWQKHGHSGTGGLL
jgi:NAD(P)-dependent dehydrogenase (short-subunit alcohol dehydrogenase family)